MALVSERLLRDRIVLKTARYTRNRIINDMGRLIVEADPGVALLLLSVGEPEWESQNMMEQLLRGAPMLS